MSGTKRRSTRQAASRKRSMYVYSDTDDASGVDNEDEFRLDDLPTPPPKKRKITTASKPTKHKPQTRSKTKSRRLPSVRSTFKVSKPRRLNREAVGEKEKVACFSGPTDHRTPNWTSLPINILRDIFIFASQPLHNNALANDNVSWLLKTARTCRAFALPALEAYYQSPALLDRIHPHNFFELLSSPKEQRYMDYNVKVKSLILDVRILAYVAHNRHAFDLAALVAELPRLQHMEVCHPMDAPPFRQLKDIQRWKFPALKVFCAMEKSGIRLKTWRWSRDMILLSSDSDLYTTMDQAHGTQALNRVERLVVCGFNYQNSSEPVVADVDDDANDETTDSRNGEVDAAAPGLATSIAKLPFIKDLTFISCDIVMDKFLQRLPNGLQRLELSNCLEITSGMIKTYIDSSGSQLRELVLNHNAALNLSFLEELKSSCPRLEVLKLDLRYYSEKVTVNDAEALYSELLSADEIPQWPLSLRDLEIVHASKWSPQAAQNLFRSLVEGAANLPALRRLVLHAHINIPWRDRIGFREQWIERLRRVYLRRPSEPYKYLGSLRQFRLWKQVQSKRNQSRDVHELGLIHQINKTPLFRRATHVQISPYNPSGDTEVYNTDSEDEPPRKQQVRRSKRVAESQVSQPSSSDANSTSEDEEEADDWRRQPEQFIQGLCDVVDVRIDNQRPREEQFTERDFLDSEASGDEDWNEDADSGDEESYAW